MNAKDNAVEQDEDATGSRPPRRRAVRILQLLHLIVLPLLIFLYLLYCVDRQKGPIYRLVVGTPIERVCLRVLPYFWRHRSFLERQAMNAALTPEERLQSKLILQRMERNRPTHCVELTTGEMLFGRLRAAEEKEKCDLILRIFDGAHTSERKLMKDEVKMRRPLVSPTVPMMPRDIRFLLGSTEMNHFYLHPYIFASDGDFRTALELYTILSELNTEFCHEFATLIDEAQMPLIHVRHFATEQGLVEAAAKFEDIDLVNASAFFRKSDNCLFLCDDRLGNHNFKLQRARVAADPTTVDREQRRRRTRHEGAHQLAAALNVLPDHGDVPFWLEEGLAQYCEQTPFGTAQPEKIEILRAATASQTLIPLGTLMSLSPQKRHSFSAMRQQLAYAQSWLLFRLLMSKAYRPKFFRYLLLQTNSPQSVEAQDPSIVLCNALDRTISQIERELKDELRNENHGVKRPTSPRR